MTVAHGTPFNTPEVWCEAQQLLVSLYEFPHAAAGKEQSSLHIDGLCGLLERFVEQSVQGREEDRDRGGDLTGIWVPRNAQDKALLCAAVATLRSPWLAWFPEYGCALLGLGPGSSGGCRDDSRKDCTQEESNVWPRPGEILLQLIALDGWGFHLHSTYQGTQHTAHCAAATSPSSVVQSQPKGTESWLTMYVPLSRLHWGDVR
ncbi:hypothetical protein VaNZ11_004551 [Volvox africanus]|uniref:Uncharacterized protein n=1 Tax=Volvox africanus TaxID=51714 RepID=A0ABQ5RXS4_9CHLO|nr:hypothetical protein VaNZ11_004551 [Volvox africanus]